MDNLFEFANSEAFGTHLIAKDTFQEGQQISCEHPLMNFPREANEEEDEDDFCCIGCFRVLPQTTLTCLRCNWPICSRPCSQNDDHSALECGLLARKQIRPSRKRFAHLKYIRILLSKSVYPVRYSKFMDLSSELGLTRQHFERIMIAESKDNFYFLQDVCGLNVTLDEILKIWRIIKINAYFIETEDLEGHLYRGVSNFEFGCRLTNSCSPNAQWSLEKVIQENGSISWYMNLHARGKISKGEIITIVYVDLGLDYGTGPRKACFHIGLTFSCLCSRCIDPKEEGTYFSSSHCPQCKRGYLLPDKPLESLKCTWNCNICKYSQEAKSLGKKLSKLEDQFASLSEENSMDDRMELMDRFIDKNHGKILHPNHYLIFQGCILWILSNDFTEILMKGTKESAQLYFKIRERAGKCIRLARKFLMTHTIAELEMSVAHAIAVYAFKSQDGTAMVFYRHDRGLKVRYCRSILRHFSEADKWMQVQPKQKRFEEQKREVARRRSLWESHHQRVIKELEEYERPFEDTGLLEIQELYR